MIKSSLQVCCTVRRVQPMEKIKNDVMETKAHTLFGEDDHGKRRKRIEGQNSGDKMSIAVQIEAAATVK